jgi:hypothetical protein
MRAACFVYLIFLDFNFLEIVRKKAKVDPLHAMKGTRGERRYNHSIP